VWDVMKDKLGYGPESVNFEPLDAKFPELPADRPPTIPSVSTTPINDPRFLQDFPFELPDRGGE
jgi:hypothetical protein